MKPSIKGWAPRSVYLHIPFCHRRCFYCDFAVVPLGDGAGGEQGPGSSSIKAYLKLLHKEILIAPKGPPLSTIYIGGGTPSLLTAEQVKGLVEHLKNHFGIQPGAELTIEMDPASFDLEHLERFLNVGINRVSLGCQSFDDEILQTLGRRHRREDILEACKWLDNAKSIGQIKTWSLDLIQNPPGQHLDGWREQLSEAITTRAPHLSIYDLSIEPGTVFAWRKDRGELNLPSDDEAADAMDITSEILQDAGFSRYEISNYALPGHASRHNRVYWSGAGWWAFGQGSTSAPWGRRLIRPRTREGYRDWICRQIEFGPDRSLLSFNSNYFPLDERLILGLRRREGIDLSEIANSWGWDSKQSKVYLSALEIRWCEAFTNGWIERIGGRVRLSQPVGMAISNHVLSEVVSWWESLPKNAVSPPNY